MRSSTSQEPSNVMSIWPPAPNLSKCYERSIAQPSRNAWCGIQPLSCDEHFKVRKVWWEVTLLHPMVTLHRCILSSRLRYSKSLKRTATSTTTTAAGTTAAAAAADYNRQHLTWRASWGERKKAERRGGEGRGISPHNNMYHPTSPPLTEGGSRQQPTPSEPLSHLL